MPWTGKRGRDALRGGCEPELAPVMMATWSAVTFVAAMDGRPRDTHRVKAPCGLFSLASRTAPPSSSPVAGALLACRHDSHSALPVILHIADVTARNNRRTCVH